METTTFYIYEVPGIKNGATTMWHDRSKENFKKYNILPILIETLVYPDTPEYWQIVGDREFELADMNEYTRGTHYKIAREKRRKGSRTGGLIGGKISNGKNLTQKGRSNGGKISGKITGTIQRTCPHCNKVMKGSVYFRHHGDNCKQK